MNKIKFYVAVLVVFFLFGCSDENSINVSAPTSIAGKTVDISVNSGSGGFATTGTATMVISDTVNQYSIFGDGVNVANSAGTYTYSSFANVGTISFDDASLGKGAFFLTFTSESSGTYTASIEISSSASQSGSFVVR